MTATKKAGGTRSTAKATNLRPGFSAIVVTTDSMTVNTAIGPVVQPAEVYVKAGGELPENLADGEYDRLDRLGAFEPVASSRERTINAQDAVNAVRGDEAKTTSELRFPTPEQLDAQRRLDAATEDVRKAFDEADAEVAAGDAE